jgi:hypothetical protein
MSNRNAATIALDHRHCRAICDEVGERLRYLLRTDKEGSDIPPRLLALLDKFAKLEEAPSMVPSIDEMSLPLGPEPLAVVKRSTDPLTRATNRRSISAGS